MVHKNQFFYVCFMFETEQVAFDLLGFSKSVITLHNFR